MQTRSRRGSHDNVRQSDESNSGSGPENNSELESAFSDDGIKSGANSVQTSPLKVLPLRNKSTSAPMTDFRWRASPKKEKDPPRRGRRNSNISEESGISPEDKKDKSSKGNDNKEIKKEEESDNSSDSEKENSDDEEKKKKDDSSHDDAKSDKSNHSQSDESMPDVNANDDAASGGYVSESESGEVDERRAHRIANRRDSYLSRRRRELGSRKHYPRRETRKIDYFQLSSYDRPKFDPRVKNMEVKTAVLTRSQIKALDYRKRMMQNERNEPGERPRTNNNTNNTNVSSRRDSLRHRSSSARPSNTRNNYKKIDEMISDSDSSEESDFDDDTSTNTIRRSKRVRKGVDRFQPSPNKKEREREKMIARQAARARGKHYNSDGSSTYSSDEYQEFREKSMLTLKPINVKSRDHIAVGPNRNTTIGDITPMDIDKSINWSSVGGLDHHIKALKEMVLFPLLYPEIFQRFQITPPKGVLFYGPPGTGKTLVARALANTCSNGSGQKISFFMRKGADILSKWVGEAERQLRLLFDEARRLQPSIVFFDEIDGLAPVRSSKQDQIHSSIVSTLLALMDGLDNRGQVIVIGATNRIDAIDPALRRPGRFDREFLFTLPSKHSRREIMAIHTQKWDPPLNPKLREQIADHCVGYCGADMKALCSEAVLNALRRNYPQIYERDQKLLLDPTKIIVSSHDFIKAMKSITPASHRSVAIHARPLLKELQPLLQTTFDALISRLKKIFPFGSSIEQIDTEYEIIDSTLQGQGHDEQDIGKALETELYDLDKRYSSQQVFRPRLLIAGSNGNGQAHLSAALLHQLEEFPVFSADLSTLHADLFSRSLEEAFVTRFNEAIRKLPAVLFISHLDTWWNLATPALQESFISSMKDIEPTLPLLLVATADGEIDKIPDVLKQVFTADNVIESAAPTDEARTEFFQEIFKLITKPALRKRKIRKMKELPLAPPPAPRELTAEEREAQKQSDEHYLRLLRMEIRDILDKIRGQRKYQNFYKPMSLELYPDYYEVVKEPMDLLTIQRRNDENYYITFDSFLEDLNLVMSNTKLYFNEDNDQQYLLSKVRAMSDLISALLIEVSKETVGNCIEIAKSGRVVPGKKVAPQLPPKPLPNQENSNNPPAETTVRREEEHRRHSARLKGESLPLEVLHVSAEEEVRQRRRKQKELELAKEKAAHEEHSEDEEKSNKKEEKSNKDERSSRSKDKPNKEKEKDDEKSGKDKNRSRDSAQKKSLKRKRDESDSENESGEDEREKEPIKKRQRTDSNISIKGKHSDEKGKEKSSAEHFVLDLSLDEKSTDKQPQTANNDRMTDDNNTSVDNVNNTSVDINNSSVEQMQVADAEEIEEEDPIQPIEIDSKKLKSFKSTLVAKTENLSVDRLHSIFVALQNCAYEERFNHNRNQLLSAMKKVLAQFVDEA